SPFIKNYRNCLDGAYSKDNWADKINPFLGSTPLSSLIENFQKNTSQPLTSPTSLSVIITKCFEDNLAISLDPNSTNDTLVFYEKGEMRTFTFSSGQVNAQAFLQQLEKQLQTYPNFLLDLPSIALIPPIQEKLPATPQIQSQQLPKEKINITYMDQYKTSIEERSSEPQRP